MRLINKCTIVTLATSVTFFISALAQSTTTSRETAEIPKVPNLPLGLPSKNIPEWERLSPSCKGNNLRSIRPCMQSFVDYGSLIGAVTLIDRKGIRVQTDAVGEYNQDTIVQIQSMSKPFVSVALMILVERGKIPSVDSKVSDLSSFQDFPYPNVTVKQLLTHTSGMWSVKEGKDGMFFGVVPYYLNRLDKALEISVRDKSLEFVAKHFVNPKLYPLGSNDYAYSNVGYIILGWIVEKLSGEPFEQFLKKNITDKLGMKDTFIFPSKASAVQRSRIANVDRRPPDVLDIDNYDKTRPGWTYSSPEAGLYSTAKDLRQFLRIFRHKGKVPSVLTQWFLK